MVLAALAGCSGTAAGPAGEADLVDGESWHLLSDELDPWFDLRPASETCDPSGLQVEAGVLEIDTGVCNWATVGQVTRDDIWAGDDLEVLAYHGILTELVPDSGSDSGSGTSTDSGGDSGTAAPIGTMVLQVGDRVVWSLQVEIPAASDIYRDTMVADWSAGAGTPVYLHVHNHGSNDWKFAAFKRLARDGTEQPRAGID